MEADNNTIPTSVEKPRRYIMFKIALAFSATCLICCLLSILIIKLNLLLFQVAGVFFGIAFFAGLLSVFLYIAAFFLSTGKRLLVLVVGVGSVFILSSFGIPTINYFQQCLPRAMCQINLKNLKSDILGFAKEHGNRVPDANWCDVLLKSEKTNPGSFVCKATDDRKGQSSYALNKNLIGIDLTTANPETVMLFETKWPYNGKDELVQQGITWNQVGEANSVALNHYDGCNFVFVSGRIKFVDANDIPKLRWKP